VAHSRENEAAGRVGVMLLARCRPLRALVFNLQRRHLRAKPHWRVAAIKGRDVQRLLVCNGNFHLALDAHMPRVLVPGTHILGPFVFERMLLAHQTLRGGALLEEFGGFLALVVRG
jgi:hypothetical protein